MYSFPLILKLFLTKQKVQSRVLASEPSNSLVVESKRPPESGVLDELQLCAWSKIKKN